MSTQPIDPSDTEKEKRSAKSETTKNMSSKLVLEMRLAEMMKVNEVLKAKNEKLEREKKKNEELRAKYERLERENKELRNHCTN